jgi:hypothetical protein
MTILIGADPELFLKNVNGKFISSIQKFGGTKLNPKPIGENCYVQEDNVAVEFNIPPAASVTAFVASINHALFKIRERASELKLDVVIEPSAKFDKDQLKHPKAKVFGCDPDWNAWTGKQNPPPRCNDKALRSAGGHVHIGCIAWMNDHPVVRQNDIARAMDLFLGVPSLEWDNNTERRMLYGKAGAFRPKEYGIEYRTLSNAWLKSSELMQWVYSQAHKAMDFLDIGNRLSDEDGDDIQKCINDSDKNLMKEIAERYGVELGTVS